MTSYTLYRAAEHEGGYFGYKSYWTPSLTFARMFLHWAERQPLLPRDGLVVWRLDIEVPDNLVLDLRPPGALLLIPSERVNARADELATSFRWIFFHEGVVEGRISTQAVHLDADDLGSRVRAVRG